MIRILGIQLRKELLELWRTRKLLIVLAVGAMVYSAVARILSGIFAIFRQSGEGWLNAVDVIGALAVLAFVVWLYTRATLEK